MYKNHREERHGPGECVVFGLAIYGGKGKCDGSRYIFAHAFYACAGFVTISHPVLLQANREHNDSCHLFSG